MLFVVASQQNVLFSITRLVLRKKLSSGFFLKPHLYSHWARRIFVVRLLEMSLPLDMYAISQLLLILSRYGFDGVDDDEELIRWLLSDTFVWLVLGRPSYLLIYVFSYWNKSSIMSGWEILSSRHRLLFFYKLGGGDSRPTSSFLIVNLQVQGTKCRLELLPDSPFLCAPIIAVVALEYPFGFLDYSFILFFRVL